MQRLSHKDPQHWPWDTHKNCRNQKPCLYEKESWGCWSHSKRTRSISWNPENALLERISTTIAWRFSIWGRVLSALHRVQQTQPHNCNLPPYQQENPKKPVYARHIQQQSRKWSQAWLIKKSRRSQRCDSRSQPSEATSSQTNWRWAKPNDASTG